MDSDQTGRGLLTSGAHRCFAAVGSSHDQGGHPGFDIQDMNAAPDPAGAGQSNPVTLEKVAGAGRHPHGTPESLASAQGDGSGQLPREDRSRVAGLVAEIRETHRLRQSIHKVEKALSLRMKAICRRLCEDDKTEGAALYKSAIKAYRWNSLEGEHPLTETAIGSTLPLLRIYSLAKAERGLVEKQLRRLAEELPIYSFTEDVSGFAALGLAQIIGEAGDLSRFANPGKLWKWMGVALVDGKRQRKVRDSELALRMAFFPERRGVLFAIGDALIKKQNRYRELYLERKAYYRAKWPDASPMHIHLAAQRYMEKRLLKNLWTAWRLATMEPTARSELPASARSAGGGTT